MSFNKSKNSLYNHLTEPQDPWGNRVVISAAGIIAGGWTKENKVFLLSADGYSISDPLTGEREIRNRDEDDSAMSKFSLDNLEFMIDELSETIKVFGLRGGNGNHWTSDRWGLSSFHPKLGEQIVGLRNYKDKRKEAMYWRNFNLIKLERLEYFTLTFGFSPNENTLEFSVQLVQKYLAENRR